MKKSFGRRPSWAKPRFSRPLDPSGRGREIFFAPRPYFGDFGHFLGCLYKSSAGLRPFGRYNGALFFLPFGRLPLVATQKKTRKAEGGVLRARFAV
jgi:hypothetical protein